MNLNPIIINEIFQMSILIQYKDAHLYDNWVKEQEI